MERLFSNENDYSSDDQQAELSQAKLKSKRNRLKNKLSDNHIPTKNKTPFYLNKNEERANMISKLMFPSLYHLDLSFSPLKNKLKMKRRNGIFIFRHHKMKQFFSYLIFYIFTCFFLCFFLLKFRFVFFFLLG